MTAYFREVFSRDKHSCVYCGKNMLQDFDTFYTSEEDHLVPKRKGGEIDDTQNIVIACSVCNRFKGGFTPEFAYSNEDRERYIESIRKHINDRRSHHKQTYDNWINGVYG